MFITENQNIGDSVLFLMAARASLSNIIEEGNTENAVELMSFIHNEASDYQVMNLLLLGKLPEEKYDPVAETMLFSAFKESMLMNKGFVTEMVGEEIFDNVLNEVDSLYMELSTQAPVLEFAAQTDIDLAVATMISERPAGPGMLPSSYAQKIDPTVIQNLKRKISAASGETKRQLQAKLSGLMQKAKASWGKATASTNKARSFNRGDLAKQKGMAAKVKAAGKYYGGKAAAAGKQAAAATSKFATSKAGMATGGAAAAALAIYAGYKIYKRFFSMAAKACSSKSGSEKTACMNKYKKQALMKQASAIQSAASQCSNSKDPAKCKAAVAKKVASVKAKAAKISA